MNSQELRERIVAWVVDVGRLASPLFRQNETSHRLTRILARSRETAQANEGTTRKPPNRR